MSEKGFDIFKNISIFHAKKEGLKAVEPFEAKRDKVAGFITGLVSEDEATRNTSNTELSAWWKTEVGDTGPANVAGLRSLMEAEKSTAGVDSPQYQKHLETYHAVVQAQTLVVQDMLVEDWRNNWTHSLVGDAAISLRHDNRQEIADGFDNVFGSNVLIGGAREVSANLITDEKILKQLDRLVEDSVDGFNSRDIGKYKDKLDRLDDDDDVNQTDYKIAREYLVNLRNRVDEIEAATRGRGVARIKQAGLDAEASDGLPGGPEYESPFHVSEEEFINALRDGGQIRFDIHEPPEWSKHTEIGDKSKRIEQFWQETMRNSIHNGAEWNLHFENDFTKIRTNPEYFMTTKDLNMYFDAEAKMAGHMIMSDLMRFYQKKNGVTMAVFKVEADGITVDSEVVKRVRNRALYTDEIALRLALNDKGPNPGESQAAFQKRIKEESGAWFDRALLAAKDKKIEEFPIQPSKENLKTAYSMQEFLFIMHVYSQADKDRMFTPMPRQIQDKQRYMIWPNQKMARKVGAISKSNDAFKHTQDGELGQTGQYKAEPATPLQLWAQIAMNFEETLGHPADGKKFVADKINDGEISFGPENMMISFLDLLTVDAVRDGKKVKETLSQALYFDHEFEFSSDQVDAMATCRDAAEQCDDAWKFFKGDVKYPLGDKNKIADWILNRNKVLGLERDIEQNGMPVFTDILRDPKVVAALMYNTRGIDPRSVAIGYPVLSGAIDNSTYSTMVDYGVDAMKLMSDWALPREVKNVLLGRSVNAPKRISLAEDFSQATRLFKMDIRYAKLRDQYEKGVEAMAMKRKNLSSPESDMELNRLYQKAKIHAKNGNHELLRETVDQIQKWRISQVDEE